MEEYMDVMVLVGNGVLYIMHGRRTLYALMNCTVKLITIVTNLNSNLISMTSTGAIRK
jgi:hypothetical protein